jgi:hypothetical protein
MTGLLKRVWPPPPIGRPTVHGDESHQRHVADTPGGISTTVVAETTYGQTPDPGHAGTYSDGAHTHGSPATTPHPSLAVHDALGLATDAETAAAIAAHDAASDPHPQYATDADLAAVSPRFVTTAKFMDF